MRAPILLLTIAIAFSAPVSAGVFSKPAPPAAVKPAIADPAPVAPAAAVVAAVPAPVAAPAVTATKPAPTVAFDANDGDTSVNEHERKAPAKVRAPKIKAAPKATVTSKASLDYMAAVTAALTTNKNNH